MPDQLPPRAEVVVDLTALQHNMVVLSGRAAESGAATMAVVKADGYGHGAVAVAVVALRAGASWLGVASVAEAIELRRAGIDAPVMAWLDTPGTDLSAAVAAGVHLSVSTLAQLRAVSAAADLLGGHGAHIHLKIDTGLHRSGCPLEDWAQLVRTAAQTGPHLHVYGIWSHLACADEPGHPSIDAQAARFREACRIAADAGITPTVRHLANSAATLTRPDLHFELVRTGIAMYGLNPVPQQENLVPAMTFRSSVVLTRRIPAGESVSYGHTWTAPEDTNLALVPVGYGDGVPRTLSGRMQVWLAGRRRDVVGRVCMDQLVVNLGNDTVAPGEEVVLFGTGEHGGPTATEWAETIGTIDYEIVTGMYRPRVHRSYVGASSVAVAGGTR
ncbi:MAG: alanine racemase [Sciscionella sp.]